MNFFYIIGIVIGFGAIVFGYVEDGGIMSSLVKISSLSIVFGGTIGIMLMANPISNLKLVPAALKKVFLHKEFNYNKTVDTLCEYANIARRDGLIALESTATKVDDDFIKKGLQYLADGVNPEFLKKALESEIEEKYRKLEAAASVFEGMGGTAPTMGVLGTVMGMVSILRDMSDMDALGGKIATAFIATLYGVGSANLLWLPLGAHIKAIASKESEYFEIVIDGLLCILNGEHPSRVKELLYAEIGRKDNGETVSSKPGKTGK